MSLFGLKRTPFDSWPRTPAGHFRLYFFAAISHLLQQLNELYETPEKLLAAFPFLAGYGAELAGDEPQNLDRPGKKKWWRETLPCWETTADHLPLRAAREHNDLDHDAMILWLTVGLIEEDSRFGLLFGTMQGASGAQRPTIGLLSSLFRDSDGNDGRAKLKQLDDCGFVAFSGNELPKPEWKVELPTILWDLIRGEPAGSPAAWCQYRAAESLATDSELILPVEMRERIEALNALLAIDDSRALVVRGPEHNGRKTLLGAIARRLRKGLIDIEGLAAVDDRWRLVGPLSSLLGAMPVITLAVGTAETFEVPAIRGYRGPIGFVLGKYGGLAGAHLEEAITISLGMPDRDQRRAHWQQALGASANGDLQTICNRYRLSGGNVRRAAKLAGANASLHGRDCITIADVREASRSLNRQSLDTLATYVSGAGDWDSLSIRAQTLQELQSLELRCAHRENLQDSLSASSIHQLNAGVRALFSGPSGTGKTLAARVLSSILEKDLYRLDLSSVVNKYIGETEKNLSRIFARAEELDVILLLDEGDALLTRRTEVQNANDRYANLETNYLLQRLESFEGILIITTNAGDRIDRAFQRRMDVVISFPPPDAGERWNIWQLHLPTEHRVADSVLAEVAQRCELTGGQIRNAILHASLLAITNGGVVTTAHLEAAVQREYFKFGSVCPLREYNAHVMTSRW
jgi:ATPase family associated with various cellular activities (AAA)